jgi:hypothetical protein
MGRAGLEALGTLVAAHRTHCPRVTQHPKVIAAFLLVIPTSGAKCFEALHLGFNIVGFEVEVHAVLGDLLVIRALEQHANRGS